MGGFVETADVKDAVISAYNFIAHAPGCGF